MRQDRFRALLLESQGAPALRELDLQALPDGDVLVQVAYSSLNYKDGLAVTGKGKVLRSYPIVPGIDLSGTVLESGTKAFRPGDRVLVTGWGIGEQYWGGYAELARVRSEWVLPLPAGLDEKQAMVLGTAGLTAALGVLALGARGLKTDQLPVLVTGASGGVGSIAVALLARRGLRVHGLDRTRPRLSTHARRAAGDRPLRACAVAQAARIRALVRRGRHRGRDDAGGGAARVSARSRRGGVWQRRRSRAGNHGVPVYFAGSRDAGYRTRCVARPVFDARRGSGSPLSSMQSCSNKSVRSYRCRTCRRGRS